jgi:CRP-like cAMP-binding protein
MGYLTTLRYADIFYGLRTEHLEHIASVCRELTLDKGTLIFEENSPGDEVYVVARGAVEIQVSPAILGVESETGPTTIATLRKGEVFGEIVLVDRGLRSASAVVAADETRLLVIRRRDLIALCEADHELGYLLMRNIAADIAFKIRGADLMVREQLLWKPRAEKREG